MFQRIYEDETKFPCSIDLKIKKTSCCSVQALGASDRRRHSLEKAWSRTCGGSCRCLLGHHAHFHNRSILSTISRCPWHSPVKGLLYIAAGSGDYGWKYFHFSDLKPGLEISQIRPELWVGAKRPFGQLLVNIQNHCHSIESNGCPCKAIDQSIVP